MGLLDIFKRGGSKGVARAQQSDLFDDQFQRKLDYLAIVSRKVFAGRMRAERRTKKSGSGIEFVDHRDYVPGDDLRYMDWNLYQRSGKLQVRLFEEEEDLAVYPIVDTSASMRFGDGEKFRYAKRVAAALSYVALANLDRVAVVGASEKIEERMAPTRGKQRIFQVFQFLRALETGGQTNLHDALRTFVAQNKRRGMAVLISDLYDPAGFEKGINVLRFNKFEPLVIHVIDKTEARPALLGDVRLYDCETGEEREVTVTAALLEKYRVAFEGYRQEIETFCTSKQVPYFAADVAVPFDELVLRIFRRGGFLRLPSPMQLVGLPLSQLLAIGAVAGVATIALYILKMRRRAVAVPFAKIWQRILRDQDATSLFSQLKRLLSLLLQLALLAMMLIALGDPRLAASVMQGRSVVVLIDASASMKAVDVAPSRIEAAKEKVRQMARGLSGTDRMLVAQMDAAITPLSTLTSDITELEAAISAVQPTDARADFPRGLRFAADTLRGQHLPEIIVASDGALGEAHDALGDVHIGDIKLSFVPIGERGKNVGITEFSVRRYPLDKSRYEVMLEVTNTHDEPTEVELSLLGDGEVVDITRLKLGPKERLPRFYPNLSGASRTLEARLRNADGSQDDLPADDHAYALLPERRRVRVQTVTAGNTYLEAALLLDEYLEVVTVSPDKYPASGKFDVTIFDGVAPAYVEGSGAALYFDPKGDAAPVKYGKDLKDYGFDGWEKKSPLLRWMVLDTIGIGRGKELVGTDEDKLVAWSADERSGKKRGVVVSGKRDGHRFLAVGFDPRESDMVLRIAWPLFLLNSINDFVEEDTRYLSSFRTGEIWKIPAPQGLAKVLLEGPDKVVREVPVHDGRAVVLGQNAGFYKLTAGPIETSFAANLSDVVESTIGPGKEMKIDGQLAGAPSGFTIGVRREVWIYLLAAAVAVSTLEWLTYHRRLTV
jgi:Ca-activated chloride channel homolog